MRARRFPAARSFPRKDFSVMPDSMSRFERSWQLIKASMDVLRNDNALLILPAISGVATALIAAGFVALAMSDGTFAALRAAGPHHPPPAEFYAWLFCMYVVQYFVVIFFNTALVGAAIVLLGGGRPTVGDALKVALSRIGAILGYAIISATVGVFLQFVAERLGVIGRLIVGGLGLAWTAATFLVVPILAAEGVGPLAAIERSSELLRKTWGENLIGNAGITLVMSTISGAIAVIGYGGGMLLFKRGYDVLGVALISAAATAFVLVVLVTAALAAIYAAAVYWYAVSGKSPVDFDDDLIERAFTRKDA
jgi:hypothetical protein